MQIPILKLPYSEQEKQEIAAGIIEVLGSNILTKGPTVALFEKEWAEYCGTKYAIACSSGTSALEMIFRSIGVEGKSVVIPSNTFIATAVAIIRAGGKVILADCEKDTLQLSLKSAMYACRDDTVAVCLVHIGGYITPYMHYFRYWADREGLKLVEDAAHSHGSTFDGHKAGALGHAGAFSFFPTKIMTSGEGGMVTTNDEEMYLNCMSLRNQGRRADNPQVHEWLGYNWRMDEIRAVLGLQQVRKADEIVGERRKIAGWYMVKLTQAHELENKVKWTFHPYNSCSPAYYKYVLLLDESLDRDEIRQAMEAKEIQMPGLVYEVPLHKQPAIIEYLHTDTILWGDYKRTIEGTKTHPMPKLVHMDNLPNTEWVSQHHLCLPLHLGMTEQEVDYVVESLKEVLA